MKIKLNEGFRRGWKSGMDTEAERVGFHLGRAMPGIIAFVVIAVIVAVIILILSYVFPNPEVLYVPTSIQGTLFDFSVCPIDLTVNLYIS